MNKKMSIMLVFLILFVSIVSPYSQNCYANGLLVDNSKSHTVIENREPKTESICRSTSISPRIAPKTLNFVSVEIKIEKEAILSEEFETVITEPKFRPQEARSNVTDGNTNECS